MFSTVVEHSTRQPEAVGSSPAAFGGNSGLYYKHITIVNDDTSVINKFKASLTDDARVIIYDCHMFIVQATGELILWQKTLFR